MAVDNQELGALAIIPQVFFDVIGRFFPGSVIIMVFLVVEMGPAAYWGTFGVYFLPQEYHLPSTWILFLAGPIACYLMSIILWRC